MILLINIDRFDCKNIFLIFVFINSSSHLSSRAFPNFLFFLHGDKITIIFLVSILTLLYWVFGSDSLFIPLWLTTRSILGNFIFWPSLHGNEYTEHMKPWDHFHRSWFQKWIRRVSSRLTYRYTSQRFGTIF